MKNKKAVVDASPVGVYEIKKYILLRSMKKIDNILRKTRRIRKMTAEFYGRIDDVPPLKTNEEQERHAKKINDFQRGIGKGGAKYGSTKRKFMPQSPRYMNLRKSEKNIPTSWSPKTYLLGWIFVGKSSVE